MRAVVSPGIGRTLTAVDAPDPEPGPGEVLVRVAACGICGSDLHLSDALDAPGLILGHEISGRVVEVGPGVDPGRIGDRVAGFPLVGCGECDACVAGATSRCASAAQLGLHRAGGFAELVTLAASGAHVLPDALDDHVGALVEPLAVAYHALDRTTRAPDAPVLVLGGGPVGAAVALWARALGAREVMVSDPVASRRALAERVGATATVDPTRDDVGAAFARLAGGAPTAVVECVGVPGLIQQAIDVAGPDACVTVVGVCMSTDEIMPLTALFKELTARFVLYYRTHDFAATIDALSRGVLDPHPLVTGAVGLAGLPERFDALKHPVDDCKVMVEPALR
jgi:(R,R)-butanediol dehydrogenase/meso-butanediol dehydrogenase/diacetyl reductase